MRLAGKIPDDEPPSVPDPEKSLTRDEQTNAAPHRRTEAASSAQDLTLPIGLGP
jgi:hypothetical protein